MEMTYKTTSAVLNWFPARWRSVLRPKTAAFEMFTLRTHEDWVIYMTL